MKPSHSDQVHEYFPLGPDLVEACQGKLSHNSRDYLYSYHLHMRPRAGIITSRKKSI